jgi:hypothetical protein
MGDSIGIPMSAVNRNGDISRLDVVSAIDVWIGRAYRVGVKKPPEGGLVVGWCLLLLAGYQ